MKNYKIENIAQEIIDDRHDTGDMTSKSDVKWYVEEHPDLSENEHEAVYNLIISKLGW